MNEVDRIYAASPAARDFAGQYLDYVSAVLARIDRTEIAAFIDVLLDARERGATIFFIGNGGSAATASHFANDIAIGTRCAGKPFRALALTDNNAVMTAIANDDGYDDVFAQQLRVLMHPQDVVVAISASGNSPNLVRAVEQAKANGAITVGLTAFDGGKLRQLAQLSVHVPTNKGEYGPAEDGHMVLDHLVGAYLTRAARAG